MPAARRLLHLLFLVGFCSSSSQPLKHMASHGHNLKHQHKRQAGDPVSPSILSPVPSPQWLLDEAGAWCPLTAINGTRKPVLVTYANSPSKNLCRWLRSFALHRVEAPLLVLGWEAERKPRVPRGSNYFLNTKIHATAAFASRCLLSSTAPRTAFEDALVVFSDSDAVFNRNIKSTADIFNSSSMPQDDRPAEGLEDSKAVLFSAEKACNTCGFRGRKYSDALLKLKGTYRGFNSGGYVGTPASIRKVVTHGLAYGCEESKAVYKNGSSKVPESSWAAKFRRNDGISALEESAPLFDLPEDQQPPCLFSMNDQSLLGWLFAHPSKPYYPRGVRMSMDREARVFQCMPGTEPRKNMHWDDGSLVNRRPPGGSRPFLIHYNGPHAKAHRKTHGDLRGFTIDDAGRHMRHAFSRRCPIPVDWQASKEERQNATMAAKQGQGPPCTTESLHAHVEAFFSKWGIVLDTNGTRIPVRYGNICGVDLVK